MKKILYVLFALISAVFAYLQLNDPDPFIWVPIYGLITLIALLGLMGKKIPTLIWLGIIVFAGGMIYKIPGVYEWLSAHSGDDIIKDMQPEKPWIENSREFGGLLIGLLMLLSMRKM